MRLLEVTALVLLAVAIRASPEDELIEGTKACAATVYRELIKNGQNQNVIFSPLTIQTLLSLLSSAATNENDEVIRQIKTALSLPQSEANRQTAFKNILGGLKSDNDFKVYDATKMYFKTGYSVEPWYKSIAQNVYGADIEIVNFGDKWGTSQKINQWVAGKTNNKVFNFINAYDLAANIKNILINTLYVMGKWDKPFAPEKNIIKDFYGPYGTKAVTMMTEVKSHYYHEDTNAQYLRLEMVRDGGGADMVFVLPTQKQGLSQLEYNIRNLLLPQNAFQTAQVKVSLPKFSFSNDMKLKPVLQNIGIQKLFVRGAQLRGLKYRGHPLILITDVLQKAFIEVNEQGVTAAAAQEVVYRVDAPRDFKEFTADHPFLFYITVDEAVVFVGRVMQP